MVWQEALKLEHEIGVIGASLISVAPAVIERLVLFHSEE